MERRGAACFGTCTQPLNRTGDCYLDCYKNTLLGDAVYNLSAMGRAELVAPWEGGFARALRRDAQQVQAAPNGAQEL